MSMAHFVTYVIGLYPHKAPKAQASTDKKPIRSTTLHSARVHGRGQDRFADRRPEILNSKFEIQNVKKHESEEIINTA